MSGPVKTGITSVSLLIGIATASAALGADPTPAAEAKPEGVAAPAPVEAAAPKPEGSDAPPKTADVPAAGMSDEFSPPKEDAGSEPADEDFGHGLQFGLRAGVVGGYRMVFRYDKSPFCRSPDPLKVDKDEQKFCGHGAPFGAEVALSFAILDFAEPYAWLRFGFGGEPQTNTEALLAFGVGARIYTMSDSKFKIFVEPALGMELEDGAGNPAWTFESGVKPEYKQDFLFHLAAGPQYDFARAVGVYVSAGLTTGVLRYIHTELEVSGGLQLRVP